MDPIAADLARSPPREALATAVAAKSTTPPALREVAANQVQTRVLTARGAASFVAWVLTAVLPVKNSVFTCQALCACPQEGEWQTVGNRRSRQGDSFGAANSGFFEGDNPLLSQTMPMPLHADGLHAPFERTYYQPGAHRGMFGGSPSSWTEPDESDGSGFPGRRGLPTRRDDLF